jgi:preprotein translocase subunit SecA
MPWQPSPTELANMQTELAAAYKARQQFMIGKHAVEISQEGKGLVRYERIDMDTLNARIEELERYIRGRPVRYGAIGWMF